MYVAAFLLKVEQAQKFRLREAECGAKVPEMGAKEPFDSEQVKRGFHNEVSKLVSKGLLHSRNLKCQVYTTVST